MKHATKLPRFSRMLRHVNAAYSKMTVQHLAILLAITADEGVEVSSIISTTGLSVRAPAISKALSKFGELGIVELRVSPADGRSRIGYLTQKGRLVFENALMAAFGEAE